MSSTETEESKKKSHRTAVYSRIMILLVVALANCVTLVSELRPFLLPFGPARKQTWPGYSKIDYSNDSLQAKHKRLHKIYERIDNAESSDPPVLKGPETVVFGNDGTMYTLTEDATLVSLTEFEKKKDSVVITAKATKVADLGMGRPLGGKFTMDGTNVLYIADALLGLTRIKDPHLYPKSKVELVASTVWDNGTLTKILYADDVAIGPRTGKVYFTDASEIVPDRAVNGKLDVLYASKIDLLRGTRTGRLLQYDPSTEEVVVLARGLFFANGVTVDKDETCVVFAETYGMQLQKYHLTGDKKGSLEVMVHSTAVPSYFDGADCSWALDGNSKGKCYVAMPSEVVPIAKFLQILPHPIDAFLRTLFMVLPRSISPKPTAYGAFAEVDLETHEMRIIQDPVAKDIRFITGVTVHENKVYLGSLQNDFIGVYDLEQ